jgi:predicted MFS family arabinose efflux permease
MFFKVAGYIADRYPAYVTIPFAFFLQASAVMLFNFLNTPDSLWFYFACLVMQLGDLFQNVCLEGLFSKHLPRDIRGSLNSIYYLSGGIGMLLFSKIAGYLYDNYSHNAPFVIVSSMDALYGTLIIILFCCGKFYC